MGEMDGSILRELSSNMIRVSELSFILEGKARDVHAYE